jgi:hypothetical protein
MLSFLFGLINPLTSIIGKIADAKVELAKAQTDKEKIHAQERVDTLNARRAVLVAESGSRVNAFIRASFAVPFDDTIPQNTEGDQYMSQAITPTSAANLLEVSHIGVYTNTATVNVAVSLYQDSGANALASTWFLNNGGGNDQTVPLEWAVQAGTTSSTTLAIRAGGSSGTISFNGTAGARKYGGALASYLRVREVMA